jgi:hypothetical protein
MNEHELQYPSFLHAQCKERWSSLLSNPKRRQKILDQLNHNPDLDPRYMIHVPPSEQSREAIASRLRKLGAPPTCYLISDVADLDQRELPLEEALELAVGRGSGTIISCIPGQLAYYEAEDSDERYILHRKTGLA